MSEHENLPEGWVLMEASALVSEHYFARVSDGWCKVRAVRGGGFIWEYHRATQRGDADTLSGAMDAAIAAAGVGEESAG